MCASVRGFHCRLVCLVRAGVMDDNENEKEDVRRGSEGRKQADIGCSIGQVTIDDAAWPLFSSSSSLFARAFYSFVKWCQVVCC